MVRIELVTVTPKLARELLGRNADNQRAVRSSKVDQYARDMAAGRWPITGDTVKVDTKKRLLDGQHRMAAVVQADCDVQMLIAYDVNPEVMSVLDTGLGRNFADVLRISGSPQRNLLSAVVRRVLQWERGNRLGTTGGNTADGGTPTYSEMLERFEKNVPEFETATSRGLDVQRMKLGSGGPGGTAFYLFADLDPRSAHDFFDSYISGADLHVTDPILALRNRMVRVGRDERLKAHEQLALFVRSWNAWREGRPLDRVMVTSGGRKLTGQNFPIPK